MESMSYVHGASEVPLVGKTIGAVFDEISARYGEQDALVVPHQSIRWSYNQLKSEVYSLAEGLLALGLDPGDRVGIWAPNLAEWVVTQFATASAGLILVNINPAYRLSELEFALSQVCVKALILEPRFRSSDYVAMLNELMPEIADAELGELQSQRLPSLRWLIALGSERPPGMLRLSDVVGRAAAKSRRRLKALRSELQFDDAINIQFTSGTTGTPKAATLSHHNIVNNAYFVGRQMRLTAADRMCIPVPMYHCFGCPSSENFGIRGLFRSGGSGSISVSV